MSMVGQYVRLGESTIEEIRTGKVSLEDLLEDEDALEAFEGAADLYLDTAWQAIHFVLSGEAWATTADPLSKVVLNGNDLSDEHVGYAPAMYLPSTEVPEVSRALAQVTEEWFRSRFSPADLAANEIYPGVWDRDETFEELFGYVYGTFQEIPPFFAEAERLGQGIVFLIL